MARMVSGSFVRRIESLFEGGSVAGLSDRQLLERFNGRRDATGETAFAALVTRHGPMVLHVCRQLLGDAHHAEDAFQAVFLVLARKAGSIRNPDLLGNWLYGVALRTAKKAKVRLDRRRKNEEGDSMRRPRSGAGDRAMVESTVPPAEQPVLAREDMEALHDEIARLPGSFRLPVVLCYFEGLTLDEVASQLRWPTGTVRSRLARARDKLRRGLTRRGVALPAAVLATALSPRSASAHISSLLCDTTTRAGISFATGQAASSLATSLAQEVLRAMLIHKLRFTLVTVFAIAACATGAGYFARSLASQDDPKRQPGVPRARVAARPDDTTPRRPAPGRMFVVGRVLDPQGKPVPSAMTMVYAAIKQPGGNSSASINPSEIGHALSDGSGRFQIDAPRTSSSRHHQMGAIALAPGYGAGWVDLDPDTDRPVADMTLRPEQVIEGRLFDVNGQPARNVEVSVERIGRPIELKRGNFTLNAADGPFFGWNPRNDLPAWPKPVMTDAEGRFTVRGVGRDVRSFLSIVDPRFARLRIPIDTDAPAKSKAVTAALEPAKMITGRITDADTGKPIPHARVEIMSHGGQPAGVTEFETDAEGHYRANPSSADRYSISAYAPEGQSYLSAGTRPFEWPKGAVEHRFEMALRRGVVIRGKVTEEGSHIPIGQARVNFRSRQTPVAKPGSGGLNTSAVTAADGSYQLAVLPGPGSLVVLGPSEDYVIQEMDQRIIDEGKPGGRRVCAHAFAACDPKAGSENLGVDVVLRRCITLEGRLVGPDDRPIQTATIIGRFIFFPQPRAAWLIWRPFPNSTAKGGSFQVHGLDPENEVPVYFLEPKLKLGATARFSGKSAAGGPVTIRLEPCGSARARFVDPEGKPLSRQNGAEPITMVISPGPSRSSPNAEARAFADEGFLSGIDPINYRDGPRSDAQGRITFPTLIPGATYRLYDRAALVGPLLKEFTVKPGETIELGDIVIEKPQP